MHSSVRPGTLAPAIRFALLTAAALAALLLISAPSHAASGGVSVAGQATDSKKGGAFKKARLKRNGKAIAPDTAPRRVKRAIAAANKIRKTRYKWGGGHGSFKDNGYDCSGAVSYVLRGARMLKSPLDSSSLMSWRKKGKGKWITVYAHGGHTFVMVAGLRFDTSGSGGKGPRWRAEKRSKRGFTVRHFNKRF